MTAWRLRGTRLFALLVTAVLPLVVWPGVARPFSTPKIWLLLGASLVVLGATWRPWMTARDDRRRGTWLAVLPGVWLASWIAPSLLGEVVSFEALATGVAGGLWAMALLAARPRARDLTLAAVAGGSSVALVALMQWAEYDPFVLTGWLPRIQGASTRMRVYATVGNPNFVAALLAGTVPLTAAVAGAVSGRAARIAAGIALALQLSAMAATGSRAGALGVVAAAATWAAIRGGRTRVVVVAAALVAAAAIARHSEGRPLRETVEGRIYMWNVVAMQALARPWVGYGPGGVEAHYLEWERGHRAAGPLFAPGRFPGPEQHAHNDYLEALVERGIPGLLVLVLIVAAPVIHTARKTPLEMNDPLTPGAAGAVAALATVAAVDFPLARPGELLLLWTAVAIVILTLTDDR